MAYQEALFSPEIAECLRYYVYRLIDPGNGETFYIGKGRGNRVFEHAAGKLTPDDALTGKRQRIHKIIHLDGLKVIHVIHRHGLDEPTAFEVEAALIDAYPGLTNIVSGHDEGRGPMHSKQIIERYEAKKLNFVIMPF